MSFYSKALYEPYNGPQTMDKCKEQRDKNNRKSRITLLLYELIEGVLKGNLTFWLYI